MLVTNKVFVVKYVFNSKTHCSEIFSQQNMLNFLNFILDHFHQTCVKSSSYIEYAFKEESR